MKSATSFIAFLALFIASCAGSFYLYTVAREREKKINERIDVISSERGRIINADSLRAVIEKHVLDSLNSVLTDQQAQIRKLNTDLTKTRRKNEELQNLYNSLRVNMPEF